MTRINCVPVKELSDQHLFAEFRELPRIRHAWPRINEPKIPKKYVLGKGHVTFFYDKGTWLERRHSELYSELISRYAHKGKKFQTIIPRLALSPWPECAMGDWEPDFDAITINRIRILERQLLGKIIHTWNGYE